LRLTSGEPKDETQQYKQVIREMIAELEDVLDMLKA
ncbi:MerR family transcriptional regulator, partial [Pseudomonas syringae pv. tagetis]